MWENRLTFFQCPACGGDLEIDNILAGSAGWIEQGVIVCNCGRHPVCWGILVLKNGHLKQRLLEMQGRGKHRGAAALALNSYGEELCRIDSYLDSSSVGSVARKMIAEPVLWYQIARYRRFVDHKEPFWNLLGRGPYADYLRHRFSSQTFWLLYPFLSVIKQRRKRILELCCGAGHASFIVSRYASPDELICLDGNFRNLFLARKLFPGADLVLADAGGTLPFREGVFSCILMMDAFHYVRTRYLLSREIDRVLEKNGASLILHVHNRCAKNFMSGNSLAPSEVQRLFQQSMILVPDQQILEDFLFHDRLDLMKEPNKEDVERCDAFCILSSNMKTVHEGIWADILQKREKQRINPIYRVRETNGRLKLDCKYPNQDYIREYPLSVAYLPASLEMDEGIRERLALCRHDEKIDPLRRRFVLIDDL